MKDKIGKLPKISNTEDALKEILKISNDKRGHVLLKDDNEWLKSKMKIIKYFAKKGLIHIVKARESTKWD